MFASDSAWAVVDEAIQILGGMGFMKATGLERVLRDLRIFRIFEGTNDILRLFVALTGIQFAGSHLQELQRAFKNPTAHLGLIFSEAGRRASAAVGLARGPDLAPLLAPELRPLGAELAKLCAEHGRSVEAALVRHGRGVVDEQLVLQHLAASAVDAYTGVAVLARASRAARRSLPGAAHELRLAEAWAEECAARMPAALAATRAPRSLRQHARLCHLGAAVAQAGGQPTPNPLNL